MIKLFRSRQKPNRFLAEIEREIIRTRDRWHMPHEHRLSHIDRLLEAWLKVHDRLVTAEMDRRNDS